LFERPTSTSSHFSTIPSSASTLNIASTTTNSTEINNSNYNVSSNEQKPTSNIINQQKHSLSSIEQQLLIQQNKVSSKGVIKM
jgi:hypothetical protein